MISGMFFNLCYSDVIPFTLTFTFPYACTASTMPSFLSFTVYKSKLLRSKKQKCKQFKFIIVNALFPARSKAGKHQWSAREYNLHFVARGIVLVGPMKAEGSFLEFCFQHPSRYSNVTRTVRDSALFAPFCADTSHTKMTLFISLCRT